MLPLTNFDELITPEKANELIENTFNYYFTRMNVDLVEDAKDTLTVEFAITSDMVSTQHVGLAFNELRSDLKDFYETLDDATFMLADAVQV